MEVGRSVGSALILIPGSVNFLYNQCGRRIGEALTDLGIDVCLTTLPNCPRRQFDYCFISNISEVVLNNESAGIQEIRSLREHCKTMISCGIDSVQTRWFARLLDLSRQAARTLCSTWGCTIRAVFSMCRVLDVSIRLLWSDRFGKQVAQFSAGDRRRTAHSLGVHRS